MIAVENLTASVMEIKKITNEAASPRPTVRKHSRTGARLTRKRTRNVSQWKSVKRKKLRQSGEAYIMTTGQKAPAKTVRSCKRDHENCRFKCSHRFDTQAQQAIHQEHWSLAGMLSPR